MSKPLARYSVTHGMPGYMPNSAEGPYYASTRKELSDLIREQLEFSDMPRR